MTTCFPQIILAPTARVLTGPDPFCFLLVLVHWHLLDSTGGSSPRHSGDETVPFVGPM